MQSAPTAFGPSDLAELLASHPELRVIDVRTPGEFASGHIVGSYNVPLPDLAEHRTELTDAATGPVVLVCQSGRRAETAEQQLRSAGLHNVHVLAGGVNDWKASGHPLRALNAGSAWTIERQVRAVAGGIVAASIGVSIVFPQARWIAGAVGVGLTAAALTDTCMMGNLLARLPYNRRAAGCDLPGVVSTLTSTDANQGSER